MMMTKIESHHRSECCPDCGNGSVETTMEVENLPYGVGPAAINLRVEVPVRHCSACGFKFTDSEADDRREKAIRRHLGLLMPEEIREIRASLGGISRKEFASVTRIGEASLARWETGQLLQGGALDHYLYLLTFSGNYERLQQRPTAKTVNELLRRTTAAPEISGSPKLKVIEGERANDPNDRARHFKLHVG
jgi:DNA-binding transcriptional regulator YiaG